MTLTDPVHAPTDAVQAITVRYFDDIARELARRNRSSFRMRTTIGTLRCSVNVERVQEQDTPAPDLPPELHRSTPALLTVYRTLRTLRGERGPDAKVRAQDIADHTFATTNGGGLGKSTVDHMLAELKKRNVAHRDRERGWVPAPGQPTLPNSARQLSPVAPPAPLAQDTATVGAPVHRFTMFKGPVMSKPMIWVPGESVEDGVVLTDVATDKDVYVTERLGKVVVESLTGRRTSKAAVRCELVSHDGKFATVKTGGEKIKVRVLGAWQLKGLDAPELEDAAAPVGA